jgi:glycosyltransferase involved in cell wall biosynthesis
MMRVAHLSVGAGGASQAAQLLNLSLSEHGVASSILPDSVIDNSYFAKIRSKKTTMLNMIDAKSDYEFLSSKSTGRILNFEYIKDTYSLLHIHNWYNLLSPAQLSEICKIMPVVITTHDERLLTGGCHTTLGCSKYLNGCSKCPASRFLTKSVQRSLKESNNLDFERIGIISPSLWLRKRMEEKLQNISVDSKNLVNIPNLIDPVFFNHPSGQNQNGDKENYNILFVSANNRTRIKNLKTLIEAHRLLRQKSASYRNRAQLHLVGANGEDYEDISVTPHGFLSKVELQELMRKMNLCCVPSLADNFPSVIAESQLSNVHVLGSNVGGIPEMLGYGSMGDVIEPTIQTIVGSIERKFIESDFESLNQLNEIRIKANRRYNSQEIVKNHVYLYSNVISGWKNQE